MWRTFAVALLALFLSPLALAQTTSVSGTITDSGAVVWKNGTYLFTFTPSPTNPNAQYFQNGVAFNKFQTVPALGPGALDNTGSLTGVAVPDNLTITPSGSTWAVQVCPAATASNGCFKVPLTITGATQNITSAVVPPPIVVNLSNPPPGAAAYTDGEIVGAKVGSFYFNLTDSLIHICNGFPPCIWLPVGNVSGTVSTSGAPAAGNLTKFSGASVITNGDLSGDVTTSGTLATTMAATIAGPKFFSTSLQSPIFQTNSFGLPGTGNVRLANGDTVTFRNNANNGDLALEMSGSSSGNLPADMLFLNLFAGIQAKFYSANNSSTALSGIFRMGTSEFIGWRNNANSGDLALSHDSGDRLNYGGVVVPTISSSDSLSNKTFDISANTLKSSSNTIGHYPRNNGTQYVDGSILVGDVTPGTNGQCVNTTGGVSVWGSCAGTAGVQIPTGGVITTPVTVNTSTTAAQGMMTYSSGSGAFNTLAKTFRIFAWGTYNAVNTTETVSLEILVLGSGGVVWGPITPQVSGVGLSWTMNFLCTTTATGNPGTLQCDGITTAQVGGSGVGSSIQFVSIPLQTNFGPNLTGVVTIQPAIVFNFASASNTATQSHMIVEQLN
jgi:hypothetical protein